MTVRPRISDLKPEQFEVVEISRGQLAVFGVPVARLDELFDKNPEIFSEVDAALRGGKSFTVSSLATKFPRAACDIVELACRPQDVEEKEILESLGPDDVMEIVLSSLHLTIPGGIIGFFARAGGRIAARMPKSTAPARAQDIDPALDAILASPNSLLSSSSKQSRPDSASMKRSK